MSGSLQGKTIVIVDDSKDIRVLVKRILEGDGASVVEAESGEIGIEEIRARAPHLVITDLSMVGLSGFDLLERRRSEKAWVDLPMIVLSGHNDRESIAHAISLGASDYILKPLRATVLLQKARKCLKATSFQCRTFGAGERPRATATFSVEILKASEAGLTVESPVKFGPDETVSLEGELLESLGCRDFMTRTTRNSEPAASRGRYRCELNFVGIGEALARAIRNRLKEWE